MMPKNALPTTNESAANEATAESWSAPSSHTVEQQEQRIPPKLLCAVIATGIIVFIGILTETMTNVLFPTLMEQFHIGTSVVQWLTTGYLLVVSIVTPLSSYLNRRLKLKTIFLVSSVLCIAGLLLASLAVNFPILMIARVLQGAGTGVALPLMFNIILEQAPHSRLGLLMGVGNMVCAIAPALGPTVGGIGCAAIGWRWMFAILIPFLVIAMIIGLMTIKQSHPTGYIKFNVAQVILLTLGFLAFVFALDQFGLAISAMSANQGGVSTLVLAIVLLIVSAVALAIFAMLVRRSSDPLIHLGILRNTPFRWHLLAYVMLEGVTIGFGYLIPNLSQLGFGSSTVTAGLLILPGALFGAILAPLGGSLLDRFGAMKPILGTMAVAIIGIILMLILVRPQWSIWMICIGYIIYMAGFSMAYPDTMTAGMEVIAPRLQADGNAMFSTFQQLAGAVGTTVMSICLGVAQGGRSVETDREAFASATQRGGNWALIVLLLVLIGAFCANVHAFISRRRAGLLEVE